MWRTEATILALTLTGCELTAKVGQIADGELGASGSSESDSSGASTESGASESESGTSEDTSSDSGEASSTEGDSTGASTESEGPDTSDSGSTEGDVCNFAPNDDFCEICLDDFCCMEQMFCAQSSSCQCMLDCMFDLPPPDCGMACQPGFEYFALMQCRDAVCNMVCN